MSRLRQVTGQMLIYVSTSSLGEITSFLIEEHFNTPVIFLSEFFIGLTLVLNINMCVGAVL